MISYDLLSSFLSIFLKAIYAYEKEFEKPGNRQQATGKASLPRLLIMVTPLRPLPAVVPTALKRLLVSVVRLLAGIRAN